MQSDVVSHMCADLIERKSEYCDEWMYWVAVKVKGSNKCRGYRVCVAADTLLATVFARKPNPRKTKRHTVAEILEGGDDQSMEDPDEAMEEFPFSLEGDGEPAKQQGHIMYV